MSKRPHKSRGPSVAKLVKKRHADIERLCREHHVQEFYLFGSAATGEFRQRTSDIDFMVRFEPCTPSEHARRYFGLLLDLKHLFNRRIDLIEIGALTNPYFIKRAEESRVKLYAS